ncbi:MAG: hypothetical protein AAGF84_07215 [Planctomycetota bacterium]
MNYSPLSYGVSEAFKRFPQLNAWLDDSGFDLNEFGIWLTLEQVFHELDDEGRANIYRFAQWSLYGPVDSEISEDDSAEICTACCCCFLEHRVEHAGAGTEMAAFFPGSLLEDFDSYIRYLANQEQVDRFHREFRQSKRIQSSQTSE